MVSKQGRGMHRAFSATDGLRWAEAGVQGQCPKEPLLRPRQEGPWPWTLAALPRRSL